MVRTTVTFADDVAAAVEQRKHERHVGVSEAVNELIREALVAELPRQPFVQRTFDMGECHVDVTCVWSAIEDLDGPGIL